MQTKRRILSFALALVMLFSMLPLSVLAAMSSDVIIGMEEIWAAAGSIIDVNIFIKENPGIIGGTLTVSWPEELTLLNDKNGTAFDGITYQRPSRYINTGTNFVWYGSDVEEVKDGTVLTLTFEINENVSDSDKFLIAITGKGFTDSDQNEVVVNFKSDYVRIINYVPGDVSGDGEIMPLDLVMLARYISDGCITDPKGYNVTLNELASDVNDDGELTPMDLILISRYISDGCITDPNGYNITLKPSTPKCPHSMEATPAVNATCTETGNIAYWYCTMCEKYYSDGDGRTETLIEDTIVPASHTLNHVNAKAASYTEPGNIEHWYCSACDKYFTESSASTALDKEDVIIPMLKRTESTVVYNVYGSDPYLESVGVDNSMNPSKYYSEDGLILNDIIAPAGYVFRGWTTAAGAPVTEIAPSTNSRQIVLNATWSKVEYTVTFDSPDVPIDPIKYTVDTGATFKNAEWYGYTFVGWSNNKGMLVQNVKPGTTGNMILHANWTSNRNRAKAVPELGKPIIIEDLDKGQYIFVYELGTIENVPLSVIEGFTGNIQGITINNEYEYSKNVQEGFADTIAKTVSNATTKTSGWTLSEDWNSSASATNDHEESKGKTDGTVDSEGNVVGSKYYVSNVEGGATEVSSSSGGSSASSSKVAINNSVGINGSYSRETENVENRKQSIDLSVGAEVKAGPAKISAGVEYNQAKETTDTEKNAFSVSNSRESSVGVESSSSSESHWDSSKTSSSSWNTEKGYEIASEVSKNKEISSEISEAISDRYSYSSTEETGGSKSDTHSTGESQELTDEYASTVEYSSSETETIKKSITTGSDATGYYRLVNAGTLHVFAVVGYDIAHNTYFTYTYNVLDKERHEYLDYSKDNANFNDCENAILPFEIPYEVHEITTSIVARSDGLVIDTQAGIVTEYNGSAEYVLIPEYVSVDNEDGTFSAVRIRGISKNAFKGNTTVKGVSLPKYVTEIPDYAFEGCTALEEVMGYGIMKIGEGAFKGCTELKTFVVDEYITALGNNAFADVQAINITAVNKAVVDATLNSGANSITLNISKLETPLVNKKLEVGSDTVYFALISNGTVYNNVQIVSHADETFLSNFALVANKDTPLDISSKKLTLNRVIVQDAPGFALIMTAEETDVNLFGNNEMFAKGDNAVLCKNINLSLLSSSVASKLIVDGNLLCCGEIAGDSLLTMNKGEVKKITVEEFEQYRSSIVVTFDSNGGSIVETENRVYYGQTYGELPIPTRSNHGFVGWFTEASGGTQITSDSVVTAHVNQKLYAHWAPNQFTLTYNANGGSCSVSTKALTFGNSLGALPLATRTHYTFNGWYTAASGGTKVSADTVPASSSNLTIYAQWTLVPYRVTWSNGTGYTITVKRTSSPNAGASIGTLSSGATVYYGDVLSVTYTKQDYYKITKQGVTSVTVTGNVDSSSIYATAALNDPSGWVLESQLPAGAQVVEEKWSYTKTTDTESKATSLSGYTQTGSYWVKSGSGSVNYASFPSGFDTSHSYYKNFNKSALSGSETATTKRIVENKWSGYVYWHWMYNVAYAKVTNRAISSKKGTYGGYYYGYFYAIASSVNCPALDKYYCNSQNLMGYDCRNILPASTGTTDGMGCARFFRFDYYTSYYTDYYKMFQYRKVENLESSSKITASSSGGVTVSNVQRLVRYRAK